MAIWDGQQSQTILLRCLDETVIHRVNVLRLQLPGIRMNFRCYPLVIEERRNERRCRPRGLLNPRGLEPKPVHHPLQLNWVNTSSLRSCTDSGAPALNGSRAVRSHGTVITLMSILPTCVCVLYRCSSLLLFTIDIIYERS